MELQFIKYILKNIYLAKYDIEKPKVVMNTGIVRKVGQRQNISIHNSNLYQV